MIAAYLYLNAVLYAGFAAWCTISPGSTARSIGYLQLNAGGESEYRVIYGGLQVGLAMVFAYLAWRPEIRSLGLLFALALYIPIVAYRAITIASFWPVPGLTLAVGAMETVLLAGAALLWLQSQ